MSDPKNWEKTYNPDTDPAETGYSEEAQAEVDARELYIRSTGKSTSEPASPEDATEMMRRFFAQAKTLWGKAGALGWLNEWEWHAVNYEGDGSLVARMPEVVAMVKVDLASGNPVQDVKTDIIRLREREMRFLRNANEAGILPARSLFELISPWASSPIPTLRAEALHMMVYDMEEAAQSDPGLIQETTHFAAEALLKEFSLAPAERTRGYRWRDNKFSPGVPEDVFIAPALDKLIAAAEAGGVEVCENFLGQGTPEFQQTLNIALWKAGSSRADLAVITEAAVRSASPAVRRRAIGAIGDLGDARFAGVLSEIARSDSWRPDPREPRVIDYGCGPPSPKSEDDQYPLRGLAAHNLLRIQNRSGHGAPPDSDPHAK